MTEKKHRRGKVGRAMNQDESMQITEKDSAVEALILQIGHFLRNAFVRALCNGLESKCRNFAPILTCNLHATYMEHRKNTQHNTRLNENTAALLLRFRFCFQPL